MNRQHPSAARQRARAAGAVAGAPDRLEGPPQGSHREDLRRPSLARRDAVRSVLGLPRAVRARGRPSGRPDTPVGRGRRSSLLGRRQTGQARAESNPAPNGDMLENVRRGGAGGGLVAARAARAALAGDGGRGRPRRRGGAAGGPDSTAGVGVAASVLGLLASPDVAGALGGGAAA